jgi:acyl-coenzyme A synthetase/AMP-(fatty) acid ligase
MVLKLSNFENKKAVITEDNKNITYSEILFNCDELVKHIKKRCLVLLLSSNTIGSLFGYIVFLNYSLLKTDYNSEFELNGELALLLTTSGSTGSPKLVRQSYNNIKANTESIVEFLKINETEITITTLPMSYTYGLSVINSHLYAGATIVLTEKTLMHKEFWQQFKINGVTSFAGVPYIYEMLAKLRFFGMKLPSLNIMTQAGGKLSFELHKKFAEWSENNNKKFIVMYGQTEATARMSYLPHQKSLQKCGSIGIAIPGGKFYLVDSEGNKITSDETVGELVYEGDNVALGYAESGLDLGKSDEMNKRLFTGDLAKFDKDGYYYIVGRKKRFLKIFGNRINLDETEELIKNSFSGIQCICGGIDDLMYIFVTDDSKKEKILKFIAEKTGLNQTAFRIKTIEQIPKNESGKTLYSELGKYYDKV